MSQRFASNSSAFGGRGRGGSSGGYRGRGRGRGNGSSHGHLDDDSIMRDLINEMRATRIASTPSNDRRRLLILFDLGGMSHCLLLIHNTVNLNA
jgi:hypothetical protein